MFDGGGGGGDCDLSMIGVLTRGVGLGGERRLKSTAAFILAASLYASVFALMSTHGQLIRNAVGKAENGFSGYCLNSTACLGNGVCRNESIPVLNGNVSQVCVCDPGWAGASCTLCGGRKIVNGVGAGSQGFVSSSGGDGVGLSYVDQQNCTWIINTSPMSALTIKLDSLFTECGWDFVYIRDGFQPTSPLIGVFSGNQNNIRDVLSPKSSISGNRKVYAYSGSAYIYFYSDRSVKKEGFNISYQADACPGNCNGQGICQASHKCSCNSAYVGDDCSIPRCASPYGSTCGSSQGNGTCSVTTDRCVCGAGRAGLGCEFIADQGYNQMLYLLNTESGSGGKVAGRAWHSFIMDSIRSTDSRKVFYVFGGYSGTGPGINELATVTSSAQPNRDDYEWALVTVKSSPSPSARYRHTAVMYGGNMYVLGGTDGSKTFDEFWVFNPSLNVWTQIQSAPVAVQGHTANVVDDTMIVIHGYNEDRGETTSVQVYDFVSGSWSEFEPQSAGQGSPPGSIGHTSTYVPALRRIFVIGGGSMSLTGLTTKTVFSFDVDQKTWTAGASSPLSIIYHTAILIGDVIVVYGGNTANVDGVGSCSDGAVYLFNTHCNKWLASTSLYWRDLIGRKGHSASADAMTVSSTGSRGIFSFGGYNGVFLNDMNEFVTPLCSRHSSSDSCKQDELCAWCSSGSGVCQVTGESCSSQVTNTFCTYSPAANFSSSLVTLPLRSCSQMRSCFQCENATSAFGVQCKWQPFSSVSGCTPGASSGGQCNANKCSNSKDCGSCLRTESCVWCQGENRCMDADSFLSVNEMGGCFMYYQKSGNNLCPASYCSQYTNCGFCTGDPLCGWCDDGSGTGSGTCTEGNYKGSTNGTCSHTWSYESCPSCQCNGHSTCDSFNKCSACGDNTGGLSCEVCDSGFYGIPQNGGICKVCPSSFNGHACGSCDAVSGGCKSCADNTSGAACESCKVGFWGSAVDGGTCKDCFTTCNSHTSSCDAVTGKCSCPFGYGGDTCNECDPRFEGLATSGQLCYFKVATNIKYTFSDTFKSLDAVYMPTGDDVDISFSIVVNSRAAPGRTLKLNISTVPAGPAPYPEGEIQFTAVIGADRNSAGTVFGKGQVDVTGSYFILRIVGDSSGPLGFSIIFSQESPPLDLVQFFITFFACFFLLCALTFGLWKLRQYFVRRNMLRNRAIVMQELAQRPKGAVVLYSREEMPNESGVDNTYLYVTPISKAYMADGRHSIITVVVDLPTRPGESRKIAFGCTKVKERHSFFKERNKSQRRFSILK